MALEVQIEKHLAAYKLSLSFATGAKPLAVLGPSGAGKTMTLRCIAGLERPERRPHSPKQSRPLRFRKKHKYPQPRSPRSPTLPKLRPLPTSNSRRKHSLRPRSPSPLRAPNPYPRTNHQAASRRSGKSPTPRTLRRRTTTRSPSPRPSHKSRSSTTRRTALRPRHPPTLANRTPTPRHANPIPRRRPASNPQHRRSLSPRLRSISPLQRPSRRLRPQRRNLPPPANSRSSPPNRLQKFQPSPHDLRKRNRSHQLALPPNRDAENRKAGSPSRHPRPSNRFRRKSQRSSDRRRRKHLPLLAHKHQRNSI